MSWSECEESGGGRTRWAGGGRAVVRIDCESAGNGVRLLVCDNCFTLMFILAYRQKWGFRAADPDERGTRPDTLRGPERGCPDNFQH